MDIEAVKIQNDGWLVNGSLSVPNDPSNRHYQEIQIWLETNEPDPEFTQAELDAQFNANVDEELKRIDIQSIRSLREYVATQSDAPQFIKDREVEAITKRTTRKP